MDRIKQTLLNTSKPLFFPHDHKANHFKALDGLRGVAVLIVLLSHASNEGMWISPAMNFSGTGKIGVFLFFVLSAYLLDRQIIDKLITNQASIQYWKYYFAKRFLRIYPLYAIVLILYITLTLLGFATVIDEPYDIPLHLLLLKGESIFWSIAVEFKYYFISPIIVLFCASLLKWDVRKCLTYLMGITLICVVLQQVFSFSEISTIRFMPIFLVGTMISLVERVGLGNWTFSVSRRKIELSGILSLLLIFLSMPFLFSTFSTAHFNVDASSMYFTYGLLWGLVLIAAKHGAGLIKFVLELKPLRFVGVISFSMYLLHKPVLRLARMDLVWTEDFRLCVFAILTLIVSTVSYLVIERPLSMIKVAGNSGSGKEKLQKTVL